MSCDKATFVQTWTDEDGNWNVTAECDGPRGCGFELDVMDEISEVIGKTLCGVFLNSEDWGRFESAHREHAS